MIKLGNKSYPTEVIEKMLERQVDCGNKRNIAIFESNNCAYKSMGGFNWDKSIEGRNFWYNVISLQLFDTFFELYPKKIIKPTAQTDKMEKEIIGYKLIKLEYKKAALDIAQLNDWGTIAGIDLYRPDCVEKVKAAGVLDLWFEPVYKTEFKVGDWIIADDVLKPTAHLITEVTEAYYKTNIQTPANLGFNKKRLDLRLATKEEIAKVNEVTYTMGKNDTGTFQLVVRDGKCFYKSEDITVFIKMIRKIYATFLGSRKFGDHDFVVKDIIISKSVCEDKETLLSEWLNISLVESK